jgi:SRSO17 transposase
LTPFKRKNIERMAEVLGDCDEQALNHFVSSSPWDFRAVVSDVALRVNGLVGSCGESGLYLDDTSFPKKGDESVGVARQWSGRLGKTDNCQVAVIAALGRGDRAAMVDFRLYLPKIWIDDPRRCRKAGIPKEEQVFRTKTELALEIVDDAREQGLQFAWVGVDSGYGKEPGFLHALAERRLTFMAGIHRDMRIALEDPRETATGPGEKGPFLRVDEWLSNQPVTAWRRVVVRHTTKGCLAVEAIDRNVWVRKGNSFVQWRLFIRREIDNPAEISFSVTNARPEVPIERLALMQAQRFFIEQVFRDAKSEAGMGDYQVRGWRAWHHHMTLVLMATLFLLQTRLEAAQLYPLLSCHDVVEILATSLPARRLSPEEILRQVEERHRRRSSSIAAAYARQASKDSS